jgi:hypothetical protein
MPNRTSEKRQWRKRHSGPDHDPERPFSTTAFKECRPEGTVDPGVHRAKCRALRSCGSGLLQYVEVHPARLTSAASSGCSPIRANSGNSSIECYGTLPFPQLVWKLYFLNEWHTATPLRHRQWLCESQKGHGHSIRSGMPTPTPKTINSTFSWHGARDLLKRILL